jgi:hypothetical protein
MRLMEALRLRVKDVDFEYLQVVVRDGIAPAESRGLAPPGRASPLTAARRGPRPTAVRPSPKAERPRPTATPLPQSAQGASPYVPRPT